MWNTCVKLCWLLSVVILTLGYVASSSCVACAKGVAPHFGTFVGTWVAHGSRLDFFKDGHATFVGRTYRWCDSGVAAPCDSIDTRGFIHSGYQEQIQFSRVAGSVAYGTIVAGNFHPRGLAVTVKLRPDDTLFYASHRPIALFCGPAAPVGMCGA